MDYNDVLRKIRYAFDFSDAQMMKLFALGGISATRAEVSNWLKSERDEEMVALQGEELSRFLNGLIIYKRGKQEGVEPIVEKEINNNIILRKLKIALALKDTDIIDLVEKVGLFLSKHELSAFFRKPTQSQYRICKDQFLRNFLHSLEVYRTPK